MTILRNVMLGSGLAAVALTSATPALADRGYYHRGGDTTGAAIAGGIVGLAVGAAVASSARRDRGYYDGPRYRTYVYRSYPRPYYYGDWDRYRWERERARERWAREQWARERWEHERWEHRRWRDWDGPRGW